MRYLTVELKHLIQSMDACSNCVCVCRTHAFFLSYAQQMHSLALTFTHENFTFDENTKSRFQRVKKPKRKHNIDSSSQFIRSWREWNARNSISDECGSEWNVMCVVRIITEMLHHDVIGIAFVFAFFLFKFVDWIDSATTHIALHFVIMQFVFRFNFPKQVHISLAMIWCCDFIPTSNKQR